MVSAGRTLRIDSALPQWVLRSSGEAMRAASVAPLVFERVPGSYFRTEVRASLCLAAENKTALRLSARA
jgi:hypothetical protein